MGSPRITRPTGIEKLVCGDIARRQAIGIAKYGLTVANNPLSLKQWLQHAFEECLDQAVYLKRAMAEIDAPRKKAAPVPAAGKRGHPTRHGNQRKRTRAVARKFRKEQFPRGRKDGPDQILFRSLFKVLSP